MLVLSIGQSYGQIQRKQKPQANKELNKQVQKNKTQQDTIKRENKDIEKKLPAEPFMITMVKQIDEFIERFNLQDKNDSISSDVNISRLNRIQALFDVTKSPYFTMTTPNTPNITDTICSARSPIILDKEKIEMYCYSTFELKVNGGNNQTMQMLLKQCKINNGYTWMIEKIVNYSATKIPHKNKKHYIEDSTLTKVHPYAHETDFVDMIQKIKMEKGILHMVEINNRQDSILQNVHHQLQAGKIEFGPLQDKTIIILSPESYTITLKDVIRETENSGWLMQQIKKGKPNLNEIFNYQNN